MIQFMVTEIKPDVDSIGIRFYPIDHSFCPCSRSGSTFTGAMPSASGRGRGRFSLGMRHHRGGLSGRWPA